MPTPTLAKNLVGKKIPSLEVLATGDQEINLAKLKTKIVLYFYPRDKTPGCTTEAKDFSKLKSQFAKLGAIIFGVSGDTMKSHESFKKSSGLSIDLIEDEKQKLCKAFDVIQLKKLYGREYLGIERSTFVIDEKGVVRGEWRKVKVKDHAGEVLEFVKNLNTGTL